MAYKKILPRYTPSIKTSLMDDTLPKLKTSFNEPERITILDILKDYLCAPMEESGLQVKTHGRLSESFENYGYGAYSAEIVGTNNINLKSGDVIYLNVNSHDKLFKVINVYQTSIIIKVLDEDYKYEPHKVINHTVSDRRIFRYNFGWKALAYKKDEYIVVKPNSQRKNCWVFLRPTDSDMNDRELILNRKSFENVGLSNFDSLPLPTRYIHNEEDINKILYMFPLFNYDTTISVRENIKRFRCVLNNTSYGDNSELLANSYRKTAAYPFLVPNISPKNSSNNIYKSKGDWVIYGDDKFVGIFFNIVKSGHYYDSWIDFSIGELDNHLGTSSFVTSGVTDDLNINISSNNPFDFNVNSYESLNSLSVFMTHHHNNKELLVSLKRVKDNSNISNYVFSQKDYNNSIFNKKVFISRSNNDGMVYLDTPYLLFKEKSPTENKFKYIDGNLYLILNNLNTYTPKDSTCLPITHSFRGI